MSMCVFACVARFWWPHSPSLAASQVFSLPLTLGDKKKLPSGQLEHVGRNRVDGF